MVRLGVSPLRGSSWLGVGTQPLRAGLGCAAPTARVLVADEFCDGRVLWGFIGWAV